MLRRNWTHRSFSRRHVCSRMTVHSRALSHTVLWSFFFLLLPSLIFSFCNNISVPVRTIFNRSPALPCSRELAKPFRMSFPNSVSAAFLLGSAHGTTRTLYLLSVFSGVSGRGNIPHPRKFQLPPSYPNSPCASSLGLIMALLCC